MVTNPSEAQLLPEFSDAMSEKGFGLMRRVSSGLKVAEALQQMASIEKALRLKTTNCVDGCEVSRLP